MFHTMKFLLLTYFHKPGGSQDALKTLVSASTFYSDVYNSELDLSRNLDDLTPPISVTPPVCLTASRNDKNSQSLPADKRIKFVKENNSQNTVQFRNKKLLSESDAITNETYRRSVSMENLNSSEKEERSIVNTFRRMKLSSKRHVKDIFGSGSTRAGMSKSSLILYGVAMDHENLNVLIDK